MKNFFESYTFLVGFMVLCIFIQMLLGKNVLNKFLWLVLAGMLVTHSDTFIGILGGSVKVPESTSPQIQNEGDNI